MNTNVIYSIACAHCGEHYVGGVMRELAVRFTEHLCSVKNNYLGLPVVAHLNSQDHSILKAKLPTIAICPNMTHTERPKRIILYTSMEHWNHEKWKQRFFVLHKPFGSLPDYYQLSYYNSEHCSKKKGTIDLSQCEQIIEALDSDHYPFLFAIKTEYRSRVRTYFLATGTEDEMITWVQCLCHVCGLRQDDNPSDVQLHAASTRPYPVTQPTPAFGVSNSGAVSRLPDGRTTTTTSMMLVVSQAMPTSSQRQLSSANCSPSFFGSQNCQTISSESGQLHRACTVEGRPSAHQTRTVSVGSIPEYFAPLPPAKKSHRVAAVVSSDGDSQSVFDDAPSNQQLSHSSQHITYDRPPSCSVDLMRRLDCTFNNVSHTDGTINYQNVTSHLSLSDRAIISLAVPLPPISSPTTLEAAMPESINSYLRADKYDIVPTHVNLSIASNVRTTCSQQSSDPSIYNPYQNISSDFDNVILDKVPHAPPKPCLNSVQKYDFPRQTSITIPQCNLYVTPPVPTSPLPSYAPPSHGNVCTVTVSMPSTSADRRKCEPYVNILGLNDDLAYVDASVPPLLTVCPSSSDGVYINVAPDNVHCGPGGSQHLCQSPQLPALVYPVRHGPAADAYKSLTRCNLMLHDNATPTDLNAETHVMWSNQRTRSFKRKHQLSRDSPLDQHMPPHISHPAHSGFQLQMVSATDDEDDLSDTHHSITRVCMATVPCAADGIIQSELKYLDLALDSSQDPSTTSQYSASHATGTDYREIDFVRTQALEDTRRVRNMIT